MGTKHTLRVAVLAALALPFAAQAEKVTVEELLKRLEQQEQKIQVLERRLEAQDQAGTGADVAAVTAQEQDQKILVLERKLEIQEEAAAAAKEATPVVSAGPKGFSIRSADGKNQIRLRGTMHLDGRYLPDDDSRRHRHLPGDPRAPDDRGHVRRHLRLQVHAGLRPGPHRDPGCVCHGALQSGRAADHGQVQVAGRPRAPAVGERHEVGAARLSRPASRPTATSACSSAATWQAAGSRIRPPS